MRTKLAGFAVFSLIVLMIVPAYATVTSVSLDKSFYTIDEDFTMSGTQDDNEIVYIIIRNEGGKYQGMLSDPTVTQGEFSAIPRSVPLFFKDSGIYTATAFTDTQKEINGTSILLEFDGTKLFDVPSFVLTLKTISDKTIEVEKTVSFTAVLNDSSIDDAVFSLSSSAPTGATIDSSTGKFVWTPTKSHGNIQDVKYGFDVIVKQGAQEDKESIVITVRQAYVEPIKEPASTPTTPVKEPAPKELGIAAFVDKAQDPQYYVDRYDNEETYKKWFDDNYANYDSIYQAVGLEEPKVVEKKFGICGHGTKLMDGVCTIIEKSNAKPWWQFW